MKGKKREAAMNALTILGLHSSQKQGWDKDTLSKDRMPDGYEEWDPHPHPRPNGGAFAVI